MKFRSLFMFFAACAVGLGLDSCKKDDDSGDTKPSFSGVLSFEIPAFIEAGQTVTTTPYGAYRKDGGSYGYSWEFNKLRDTTKFENEPETVKGTYTFTVPDTLASLTVTATIFGNGYYSSSTSRSFTAVKPKESIPVLLPPSAKSFSDERDGKKINYVRSGDLDWMIGNLSYAETGAGYSDCDVMKDITGTFYTWDAAIDACPDGWRLPTKDEYLALCGGRFEGAAGSLMVNAYFNEDRMWEYWPEVDITNKTSFSALPAGYGNFDGEKWSFTGMNEYAAWWTADSFDDDKAKAVYIMLNVQSPDVALGYGHKEFFGANVRCVRDVRE